MSAEAGLFPVIICCAVKIMLKDSGGVGEGFYSLRFIFVLFFHNVAQIPQNAFLSLNDASDNSVPPIILSFLSASLSVSVSLAWMILFS